MRIFLALVLAAGATVARPEAPSASAQGVATFPGFKSTELPFQTFGDLVTTDGGHSFISAGPTGTEVVSLHNGGGRHRVRRGFSGPDGLAIHQGRLYVANADGFQIERLGMPGLRRFESFPMPSPGRPGALASAGGRLWTSLGACDSQDHRLASLNTDTGAVTHYPRNLDLYPWGCIGFATHPAHPNLLLAWSRSTSGPTLFAYDAASAPAQLLWKQAISHRVADATIDASSNEVVLAGSSGTERRDLTTGEQTDPPQRPAATAVAHSPGQSSLAVATDESGGRVVLRSTGEQASEVTFSLPAGRRISRRALAWRGNENLVHGVSERPGHDAVFHIFNPTYRNPNLKIWISKRIIRSRERVRVVARLAEPTRTRTRRIVILASADGVPRSSVLKGARMDSRGRVRAWTRPHRNMNYEAVWAGDEHYAPARLKASLGVRLRIGGQLRGEHHRMGRLHFYTPDQRVIFRARTRPRRSDTSLIFVLQRKSSEGWRRHHDWQLARKSVSLERGVAVIRYRPRRDGLFGRFRVRAIHRSDVKHQWSTSRWFHFQVDPGYPPW